ncbi:230_t:CDS:2, partial [Paraglomus occultum]
ARGIGLLLAETLSIKNVVIVVLHIRKPEIEHPNIVFFECDVSKYDQVQKIAKEIIAEVGHPTIIINNAGVVKGKNILDESEEEILSTVGTNLLASFWITKTFLPEMVGKNHGHIAVFYNASNVRCTLVCPGQVETGMFDGVSCKYPFFAPTLAPIEIVKKIITALDKNETSDILIPYHVNMMPVLRALPGFLNDWVYKMMDADDAMKTWNDTRDKSKKQ